MITKSKLSAKTQQKYTEGIDPLKEYINNYAYDNYNKNSQISEITLNDIDYLLSYHIIRKYIVPTTFIQNAAQAIGSFFIYAANLSLYDTDDAKTIQKMTHYYNKQYPRLDLLQTALRNLCEGKIDQVMKLPKKQREAAINTLKQEAIGSIMKDVGYVEIIRIEDGLIFVKSIEGGDKVGPIKINEASSVNLRLGDIINMCIVCKPKNDSFWEIVELGNVYPKPYLELEKKKY